METKAFLCYCESPMVQRESQYGKFWSCSEYPRCEGTVGAHQRTGKPLGIAADKVTRGLRKECHDLFDAMWKEAADGEVEAALEATGITADDPEGVEYVQAEMRRKWRSLAYRWMKSRMGIFEVEKDLHIGELDHEGCRRFILRVQEGTLEELVAFAEWEIEDQFEKVKRSHLRDLKRDEPSTWDGD